MKILFIVNSLGMGGAEKHTLQLAEGLEARGADTALYTVAVNTHYTPSFGLPNTLQQTDGNGLLNVPALRRLSQFIRFYQPDVIAAVNGRPLYYAHVAARLSGKRIPIAYITHSTGFANSRSRILNHLYRYLSNHSNITVFVSALQKQWWAKRGFHSKRMEVILNGVDSNHYTVPSLEEAARERERLGIGANEFVVGMVCALRPEKNPVQLIKAVSILREKNVLARAVFIGDGPLASELKKIVTSNGYEGFVTFAGKQQDTRPWVSVLDVGVLCSTTIETFSLAALEIMAMGRPVVLSETGGAAEMVRNGENGYLFPVGDTNQLVTRLTCLADREVAAKMGNEARERVQNEFTLDRMFKQYEQLFVSLIENK